MRRKRVPVRRVGVDETSFQRRHEYVTIVTDLDGGCALHVADDRNRESLDAYVRSLTPAQLVAIEVVAMDMWRFVQRGRAEGEWPAWLRQALRCRLDPVKKVARMIQKHRWGVVHAIAPRATNAARDSVNAKIQRIKRAACGSRSRQRFRNGILFHLGGLDLYPAAASATHTTS